MDKRKNLDHLSEEAINSADAIQRATPAPFLFTRINARLNQAPESVWEKAGWFISRPAIAFAGLCLIIFINVFALTYHRSGNATNEQVSNSNADEYSYTVATIYDIENTEP